MQEDNLIEFSSPHSMPKVSPIFTYHYSAFRTNKSGATTWFDGIMDLDALILTQEHYGNVKKLIAEHYDVPETNIVIVCLTYINGD